MGRSGRSATDHASLTTGMGSWGSFLPSQVVGGSLARFTMESLAGGGWKVRLPQEILGSPSSHAGGPTAPTKTPKSPKEPHSAARPEPYHGFPEISGSEVGSVLGGKALSCASLLAQRHLLTGGQEGGQPSKHRAGGRKGGRNTCLQIYISPHIHIICVHTYTHVS